MPFQVIGQTGRDTAAVSEVTRALFSLSALVWWEGGVVMSLELSERNEKRTA